MMLHAAATINRMTFNTFNFKIISAIHMFCCSAQKRDINNAEVVKLTRESPEGEQAGIKVRFMCACCLLDWS